MSKPVFKFSWSSVLRLSAVSIASSVLLNTLSIPVPKVADDNLNFEMWHLDQAAYARSGGRSRGGSFSGGGSSGGSSGGSKTPSQNSGGSGGYSGGGYYGGGYYGGGYYGGGYGATSSAGGWVMFIVALVFVGGAGLLVWYLLQLKKGTKSAKATVTKVQVALLAQGKAIQSQLSELVESTDLSTPQGVQHQLQESALALLRMPENWSHVLVSSETLKSNQEAEVAFEKLSITERTKYSTETLTNQSGELVRKDFELDPDKEPASYIVVTLLVGTSHDKPLFTEVRSTEALKTALQQLSSLNADDIKVFELIWTPQAEGDTMTYDELLLEYPNILQI